ncbi:MAG: hypothetical protein FH751_09130 [Firmicutes bacterium]|nr:hypothetical protein [Bacillota bacterium]
MDKYSFSKDIINQLSSRLDGFDLKKDTSESKNKFKDKSILVVFTGTNIGLKDSIKELVKLKRYGFKIDIAFSKSAEKILDLNKIKQRLRPSNIYTEENKYSYMEIIDKVNGVIIPMTTQNTAFKLALGLQDDFISTLLWRFLWQGKKVLMDMSNVNNNRGDEPVNPVLKQMVDDYTLKLKNMGIKEVNKKNYVLEVLDIFNESDLVKENEEIIDDEKTNKKISKKVITESDIKEIKSDKLIISKKTIITPLAKDKAKELNISIVKK